MKIGSQSMQVYKSIKEPKEILLTRKEAAALLDCKETTLAMWKYTKRYPLPYVKIGANVRYKLSDVQKFIEQNTNLS